jgi:hypothetical protein
VFTGCPEIGAGPDGVQCSGTGYAPRAPDQYIPEHYFTSGSPC